MNKCYILSGDDGHTPIACDDFLTWGRWMEGSLRSRQVGLDLIGPYRISTAFLGLDHEFRNIIVFPDDVARFPPILFETMIFADALQTLEQKRQERALLIERMQAFTVESPEPPQERVEDQAFSGYQTRCSTWTEAVAQHGRAVAAVRASVTG